MFNYNAALSFSFVVLMLGLFVFCVVGLIVVNSGANKKNAMFEEARKTYETFSHRIHKYFGISDRFRLTTAQGEAATLLIKCHNHPCQKNLEDLKSFCKNTLHDLEIEYKSFHGL